MPTIYPSVVRQLLEVHLFKTPQARVTLARMSLALAVQMNGLGLFGEQTCQIYLTYFRVNLNLLTCGARPRQIVQLELWFSLRIVAPSVLGATSLRYLSIRSRRILSDEF